MTRAIDQIAKEQGRGVLSHLCQAAGLSRASFYRLRGHEPVLDEAEAELRSRIQQIALRWPVYGYRRITAELNRSGCNVNHKRVLKLMREDNLLCLRRKRFVPTTDSAHNRPVYPNLANGHEPSGINQLWVADLTYVRLRREFIYAAVVLDAYSRRVVGWSLGRSLDSGLALEALRQALGSRTIQAGLIHHSDRGVQYASEAYTSLLKERGISISMSRRACPYDNAQAESFIKTLKYEEVYVNDYESLKEARASIGDFLDRVYNQERLHSALGYCPPAEFEERLSINPSLAECLT